MTTMESNGHIETIADPTNDASNIIELGHPYHVNVRIQGTAPILFHRWSSDAVEAKAAAKKGSAAKKTDDVESYVYRDQDGHICIPGTYLRGAVVDKKKGAARYLQDPRSPRKMATDLYESGLIATTDLAKINGGVDEWDYLDRRRCVVQQSGITRTRPAFSAGWTAEFAFLVTLPEYIAPNDLLAVLTNAGLMVGIADYRPTFGRFQVTAFDIGLLA